MATAKHQQVGPARMKRTALPGLVFEPVDPVIHQPARLSILSVLAASESMTFCEVKELTGLTDGNLSIHVRNLETHGLVKVDKSFVDRRPQTRYSLTPKGRKAFAQYLGQLEEFLRRQKGH